MHDELNETDLAFGRLVADKYIGFARDKAPWTPYHPNATWGIYDTDYKICVRTEGEDDKFRRYSVWDKIEEKGLMSKFLHGCKCIPKPTDMKLTPFSPGH